MNKELSTTPRHYPIVAVGGVVIHQNKILLVKRGKPPSLYLWAIPGGKVKPGETLQSAVEREVFEETGLMVDATTPIYTFDLIEHSGDQLAFHYVIVDLIATYVSGELAPAGDALDAGWFSVTEVTELDIDTNTLKFLKSHTNLFA